MIRIFSLCLSMFISINIYAQNYGQLIKEATDLYNKKEYKLGLEKIKDAFKIKSDYDIDLYNGACIASLADEKKLAFKYLFKSMKYGYINVEHLKKDIDLDGLHNKKKWKKLVTQMQQNKDKIEANYDKPLKAKLESILASDQGIRRQWSKAEKEFGMESKQADSVSKIMHYTDSLNLIEITSILDKYGWLGKDKVGEQGNMCLFLVIQHSDLQTQKKYLPMMRDAVKNKKAKGTALALLEDRVALGEKKPQIYGSQIGYDKETKKFFVCLLSDPDNVDKKRKEVGLGLLADYAKNWDIIWNVEEYKKDIPRLKAMLDAEK